MHITLINNHMFHYIIVLQFSPLVADIGEKLPTKEIKSLDDTSLLSPFPPVSLYHCLLLIFHISWLAIITVSTKVSANPTLLVFLSIQNIQNLTVPLYVFRKILFRLVLSMLSSISFFPLLRHIAIACI